MKNIGPFCVAAVMATVCSLGDASSGYAGSGAGPLNHLHSRHHCPRCTAICCRLNVETVDAEKSCWQVECETICIPRVVFPWQKDCCNPGVNNGARVKTVRVLKQHKYTCPECEYSWTPVDRGCCGVGCCNDGCVACDGMPIEMGMSVPEPSAIPAPPEGALAPPQPTPAEGAATGRGFIEHQKVNVVSFMSGWMKK